MSSGDRLSDDKMSEILGVDLRTLYGLTKQEFNQIHRQLQQKKIISETKYFQFLGESNDRIMINDTWEEISKKGEEYVKIFGYLLRQAKPGLFTTAQREDRSYAGDGNCLSGPATSPQKLTKMPCYLMNKKPHGIAVIFNQVNYTNSKPREGSWKDALALEKIFSKFNYAPKIWNSLSKAEIEKKIQEYSATGAHVNYDSFICVFLSHGNRKLITDKNDKKDVVDCIIAKDSGEIYLQDVYDQFSGHKCPSLVGKPKIFITQACRGDNDGEGVPVPNPSGTLYATDNISNSDKPGNLRHPYSDFLMAYSTVQNFQSLRDPENGSWFIQELVRELESNYKSFDLLDMLTNVNRRLQNYVINEKSKSYMQQPLFESSLSKKFYFSDA